MTHIDSLQVGGAATSVAAIAKYSAQLADIFAQRQAIKAQFPKPTE